MLIHLLGDAVSPWLIGEASDRIGLKIPVLITGCLLAVSGLVLLFGRKTLERDLETVRRTGVAPAAPTPGAHG
jgi:MFS family permease